MLTTSLGCNPARRVELREDLELLLRDELFREGEGREAAKLDVRAGEAVADGTALWWWGRGMGG